MFWINFARSIRILREKPKHLISVGIRILKKSCKMFEKIYLHYENISRTVKHKGIWSDVRTIIFNDSSIWQIWRNLYSLDNYCSMNHFEFRDSTKCLQYIQTRNIWVVAQFAPVYMPLCQNFWRDVNGRGTHECGHFTFVWKLRDKVETFSFPLTCNWFTDIFPRALGWDKNRSRMLCRLYIPTECIQWDSRARVIRDEAVRVWLSTLSPWALNTPGNADWKQLSKFKGNSQARQETLWFRHHRSLCRLY